MRKIFFVIMTLGVIGSAAVYAAGQTAGTPKPVAAAAAKTPETAFRVPALPYAYDALSPVIDAETMQLHHDKHHQAYVDKLNDAVAKDTGLQGLAVNDILSNVSTYDQTVRDNAGGHYNHSVYWSLMAPKGTGGQPSAALLKQINTDFGSLDAFKTAFETAGAKCFGSGWVWLIWTGSKLAISTTLNQDNPLMDDVEPAGKPVLANDVWEHAYYLTYRNKRADYLKAWWQVVNWNEANRLFDAARA